MMKSHLSLAAPQSSLVCDGPAACSDASQSGVSQLNPCVGTARAMKAGLWTFESTSRTTRWHGFVYFFAPCASGLALHVVVEQFNRPWAMHVKSIMTMGPRGLRPYFYRAEVEHFKGMTVGDKWAIQKVHLLFFIGHKWTFIHKDLCWQCVMWLLHVT